MSEEQTPKDNLDPQIESQNNESVPNSPADSYQISSVRTYKGDLNETVQNDKINTAKIFISEQRKRDKEELKRDSNSIENNTNKFKLLLGVFFIAIAIVAIAFVAINFLQPKNKTNQNVVFEDNSKLFVIDKNQSFDVTNKTRDEINLFLNEFLNTKFPENSLNEVIFYQTSQEGTEKQQKILNSVSVLKILKIDFPDVLKRSLSNDYIVGTYSFNSKNNKFIIFKLADFANAYDSMFGYEKDIIGQMRNFFGGFEEYDSLAELRRKKVNLLPKSPNVSNSTTTVVSTSTTNNIDNLDEIKNIDIEIEKFEKIIYTYKNFIDIVLQNNDSRAIVDKNSNVLFYYTFIDREWILFADNIEVLKEVKRRIREKNLTR